MVTASGAAAPRKGLVEWVLVAIGLCFVASSPPQIWGDALVRFESLRRLFEQGHLDAGRYSLAGPIFSAPLWALHKPELFNLFVFAIGIFFLQRILGARFGLDGRARARFALFLLCACEFPLDLQEFYGEPFTAFTIAIGLAGLLFDSRAISLAGFGALIVLGTINTPGALVATSLSCVVIAWRRRDPRILVIPALALAGILVETWLRRGSVFINGYEGDRGFRNDLPFSGLPGFSYPIIFGALSLLFSFGRGLLFFAPGTFLSLPDSPRAVPSAGLRDLHRVWLVFVFGLLIVYARWWGWSGGIWFGPRYVFFAMVPASLSLALRADDSESNWTFDLATLVAATVALWVGFTALVYGKDSLSMPICQIDNYRLEPYCWYVPEYSALALPIMSNRLFSTRDWLAVIYFTAVYLVLLSPLLRRLTRAAQAALEAALQHSQGRSK